MKKSLYPLSISFLLTASLSAPAYDFSEQIALNVTLKGVYQQGHFKQDNDSSRHNKVMSGLDAELIFRPFEHSELSALLRFGKGDGLNAEWTGGLATFAHDGESDLKNINDSGRDYLLTAAYTHTFSLATEQALELSLGLLDSTGGLDENAYAADELGQFMNDALVHNPVLNLPSYDIGSAVSFTAPAWSLKGVVMQSKSADEAARRFEYYGVQAAWHTHTYYGAGNYRLIAYRSSQDFLDINQDFAHDSYHALSGWGISFDQAMGKNFGVFVRYGRQSLNIAVDYRAMSAIGMHLNGSLWGRAQDQAGTAYAYLQGGNGDIDNSQVWETYVNFALTQSLNLSLNVQYLHDKLRHDHAARSAWIPGIRVIAMF
jgi:hypothetical protein